MNLSEIQLNNPHKNYTMVSETIVAINWFGHILCFIIYSPWWINVIMSNFGGEWVPINFQ